MKTLTVLILVQTAVLLVLFGKIVAIEKRVPVAEYKDQDALFIDAFDVLPADAYSSDSFSYANENQLRNIIREELAAQLESLSDSIKRADVIAAPTSATRAYDPNQREQVAQKVDYYSTVGSISSVEMQKLQWEIAKLDVAGRREMLGRLVQAINSGALEGEL